MPAAPVGQPADHAADGRMAVDEIVGPFVHPLFTQPEGLEKWPPGP